MFCLIRPVLNACFWTSHFVMLHLNWICLHYLQHLFFDHLFNLYFAHKRLSTLNYSYTCDHAKILQKSVFVENVWPENLALFIYVSTHCVKTVKWLDYNRYSQLTRWWNGNASALGARCPVFNPRLRQGFLCLIFCFIVVVFLLFVQKHIICHKRLQFLLQY